MSQSGGWTPDMEGGQDLAPSESSRGGAFKASLYFPCHWQSSASLAFKPPLQSRPSHGLSPVCLHPNSPPRVRTAHAGFGLPYPGRPHAARGRADPLPQRTSTKPPARSRAGWGGCAVRCLAKAVLKRLPSQRGRRLEGWECVWSSRCKSRLWL